VHNPGRCGGREAAAHSLQPGGEAIGLERDYAHPGETHVEWQLREIGRTFHRLPPKDDSCRSPNWEPCLPVDLPPFLDELLATQLSSQPERQCLYLGEHGGSGRYVLLGPDNGHYRRSNYARRIFRPACDGRLDASPSRPGRIVVADAATWPGIPLAAWPPAQPGVPYTAPRGRGVQAIPDDIPLVC
jgi:hypothetical protein